MNNFFLSTLATNLCSLKRLGTLAAPLFRKVMSDMPFSQSGNYRNKNILGTDNYIANSYLSHQTTYGFNKYQASTTAYETLLFKTKIKLLLWLFNQLFQMDLFTFKRRLWSVTTDKSACKSSLSAASKHISSACLIDDDSVSNYTSVLSSTALGFLIFFL